MAGSRPFSAAPRAARIGGWLLFVLVAALLPLHSMPTAAAQDEVVPGAPCFLSADDLTCPTWDPHRPPLLNVGYLMAAGPKRAAALLRLQDEAVDDVLAEHHLPDSDRDAVLTWDRAEAQAKLWMLIYHALDTPEAERTADQQLVVEWMDRRLQATTEETAVSAATEYVKWAGLNQGDWRNLLVTGPSQAQLESFLSGPVRNFNSDRSGGYCVYQSPAPYQDEYVGRTSQMCYTTCTVVCSAPTPKYDQFVQWGLAASTFGIRSDNGYVKNAAAIALGATFGAAYLGAPLVGAAVGVGSYSVMVGMSVAYWSMPFQFVGIGETVGSPLAVMLAETFGLVLEDAVMAPGVIWGLQSAATATAIAGTVAVVIAALTTAILAGIKLTDEAALPGRLAGLVAGSWSTQQDAAALTATESGTATLFQLFSDATFPRPRPWTCDNDIDMADVYTYYDEETSQRRPWPFELWADFCLNPTAVPSSKQTDPHFSVEADQSSSGPLDSPSIELPDPGNGGIQSVRVSGNWFVKKLAVKGPAVWSPEGQSLGLDYLDWKGTSQHAWLVRDLVGSYSFIGISSGGQAVTSPSDCKADGVCWTSQRIEYVGRDGKKYAARVKKYVPPAPPTGTPTVTPDQPMSGTPVTFAANTYQPAGAVAPVSYRWRFQKAGCGVTSCQVYTATGQSPDYEPSVAGATVSHTWETSGTYQVELTATAADGKTAVKTWSVDVGGAPPKLTINADCSINPGARLCNRHSWTFGEPTTLNALVSQPGRLDTETMSVTWGDGTTPDLVIARSYAPDPLLSNAVRYLSSGREFELALTHTYAKPGEYIGRIDMRDNAGNVVSKAFAQSVNQPQQVTWTAMPAQAAYGDTVQAAAQGASGQPATFTAGPARVCTATGPSKATITMVGVGYCVVDADLAEDAGYFAARDRRTITVTKASLTIAADKITRVYGSNPPSYTASYTGLVNGDTAGDLTSPSFTGAPASSSVGTYPIRVSGVTNPNYDVTYVDGVETVTKAPLTITANDLTRTYGATAPAYSAKITGLVNGDTAGDLTSPSFTGAPASSSVGTYPIRVSGATNPDYDVTYVDGVETVTKAPLTITANDLTRTYGATAPAYSAKITGLVNGDQDNDVTYTVAGPPASSGVGTYPIRVSGVTNPNYEVAYVDGVETVTKAPLTIAADSITRTYGATAPAYSAKITGLVNGDQASDFPYTVTGPPASSAVGTYPVTVLPDANPNYDITPVHGTVTVTAADLTITATDATIPYGGTAVLSWTASGWVNGDSDSTLGAAPQTQAPTCSATVNGNPVTSTTPPGVYADAIACDGAAIPNYTIHYAKGSLTVNPVVDPPGTVSVEGTVTVDDGRSSTRSRDVQLSLAATNAGTGVTQMRFSNDGSTWSAYRPYAATAAWSLSGADGTKTVYAQFADASGNFLAVASDTIALDSTGPRAVKITPRKRAKNASVKAQVEVVVSEAVTATGIDARSVVLTRNGTKVSAKVVYRPARHSILLRPTEPLKAGTYHLTIRTTITDVLGNRWDDSQSKRGLQPTRSTFTV